MSKGPTAKIEVLITLEYELPYWDKDRHELYNETDPSACIDCDVVNMQDELDKMLDREASFLGFPTDSPEVNWWGTVSCESLTPAIP